MDPLYGSSNFVSLLNSQQGTHIPMCSFPQADELQSPEVHVTTPTEKRRKWSPTEDVVLCSAWLNTSKDAVVGNEQRLNTFWKRVCAYFNASPKLKDYDDREASNCKQRWQKINDGVSKFVGSYEAATRHKSSGMNDDDVLKSAYSIFLQDHNVKFNLEHAWLELRHDQKWCASFTGNGDGKSKKKRVADQEASSNFPESVQERPGGVKAAKAKGKKKCNRSMVLEGSESFQSMWEIKEKDLVLKKELGKDKLLHSLLSKKEPLTELETKLKEKLITNMLND